MLDQRVRDYILETGEQFPVDSLASIMRRAVDPDTSDRMDEGNVDVSDFAAVAAFIKKRESRLRSRCAAPSAGKGPDAMVYGMSAPEAPAPQPGLAVTAPEIPIVDPWAGAAADPWAHAALPAQAPQPEQLDWALDAFGKGKGKGGGDRGPMQC